MVTLLFKRLSKDVLRELQRLKVELESQTWAELLEKMIASFGMRDGRSDSSLGFRSQSVFTISLSLLLTVLSASAKRPIEHSNIPNLGIQCHS